MSTDPRPVPLGWFGLVAAVAVASVVIVLLLSGLIPRLPVGGGGGPDPLEKAALKIGELRQAGLDLKTVSAGAGTVGGVLLECTADGRNGWIEIEVGWQGGMKTLSSMLQADHTARVSFTGEPGAYHWRARTLSMTGERGFWKEFGGGASGPDFLIVKPSPSGPGTSDSGNAGGARPKPPEPPRGTGTSSMSGGGPGDGPRVPLPSVPLRLPSLWSLLTSTGLVLGGLLSIAAAGALLFRKRRKPL